ncbi:MAG: ATP-binding protein [Bryobacteraceae bacterium]
MIPNGIPGWTRKVFRNEGEHRFRARICEERHQARSTVLRSQLPVTRLHEQIGDRKDADRILHRLVYNAQRIEMLGDSMRKNRGKSSA